MLQGALETGYCLHVAGCPGNWLLSACCRVPWKLATVCMLQGALETGYCLHVAGCPGNWLLSACCRVPWQLATACMLTEEAAATWLPGNILCEEEMCLFPIHLSIIYCYEGLPILAMNISHLI